MFVLLWRWICQSFIFWVLHEQQCLEYCFWNPRKRSGEKLWKHSGSNGMLSLTLYLLQFYGPFGMFRGQDWWCYWRSWVCWEDGWRCSGRRLERKWGSLQVVWRSELALLLRSCGGWPEETRVSSELEQSAAQFSVQISVASGLSESLLSVDGLPSLSSRRDAVFRS